MKKLLKLLVFSGSLILLVACGKEAPAPAPAAALGRLQEGQDIGKGDPPDRVVTQETVTNMSLPKGGLQEYRRPLIVMYSLTTCSLCHHMRHKLESKNIAFIEYFIDEEPIRQEEVMGKLRSAGLSSRNVGTPILEVNGIMLPNNPSMTTVLKHLQSRKR